MIFVQAGGECVCTVVCTPTGHTIAAVNSAGGEETGTNASGPDAGPDTRTEAAFGTADPDPGAPGRSDGSRADPRAWLARLSAMRERIRRRPGPYRAYRLVVGLTGFGIVGGGIALLPLPGPGWVIVFVGLHVLATEFAWAAAVERYARARVAAWTAWLGRRSLLVRIALGALTVLVVLAVVYGLFALSGVPGWVPQSWVPDLPGLR
jgi:uncharacterized protein (TIGR02611 family)